MRPTRILLPVVFLLSCCIAVRAQYVLTDPTATQTITQPSSTSLNFAGAGSYNFTAPEFYSFFNIPSSRVGNFQTNSLPGDPGGNVNYSIADIYMSHATTAQGWYAGVGGNDPFYNTSFTDGFNTMGFTEYASGFHDITGGSIDISAVGDVNINNWYTNINPGLYAPGDEGVVYSRLHSNYCPSYISTLVTDGTVLTMTPGSISPNCMSNLTDMVDVSSSIPANVTAFANGEYGQSTLWTLDTTVTPSIMGTLPSQVNIQGIVFSPTTTGTSTMATTIQFVSGSATPDSSAVIASSSTLSITAWSVTSNVATFTATNSLVAGQIVALSGFTTSTFFNGQNVVVSSTGLSGSQFEATFYSSNASATETGSGAVNAITVQLTNSTGGTRDLADILCLFSGVGTGCSISAGAVTTAATGAIWASLGVGSTGTTPANATGFINFQGELPVTRQASGEPTPTTFAIATPTALSSGQLVNMFGTTTGTTTYNEVTSVATAGGLSGGIQFVTAPLYFPHTTNIFCADSSATPASTDVVGKAITLDVYNPSPDNPYTQHVLCATNTNTVLVGTNLKGAYMTYGNSTTTPASVHIYNMAVIHRVYNPAGPNYLTPTGTYAEVEPHPAFAVGHTLYDAPYIGQDWQLGSTLFDVENPFANVGGFYYELAGRGVNGALFVVNNDNSDSIYSAFGGPQQHPPALMRAVGQVGGIAWTEAPVAPVIGVGGCTGPSLLCVGFWPSGLISQTTMNLLESPIANIVLHHDTGAIEFYSRYGAAGAPISAGIASLGSGSTVGGYPICTTAGGAGCSGGTGGGVPSVNGITSAVTIAAGDGVSVTTSGSTVTVANTEPLTSAGLQGVLAASPFNIGSSSYCGSGAIYTSPSADGLIQCDSGTLHEGDGSWILYGTTSPYPPGIELYGPSSYISLLSNQPGTFGPGLQLLGDDTTFDAGSGTEYLHNAAGDLTVSIIGALGRGIFSGGLTATIYQETLTTPFSSSATCTAGQFTDDANYHYVCVATNTWKRAALSSF